MEMANCLRCKRVFPKIVEPICEACKRKDEELFAVVRKYLEEHPSSTIHQISATTGASTKKIMAWLREGRLEIAEATGDLKCRQCGADISTGQFCEACTIEIKRQIGGLYAEKPVPTDDDASFKKGVVMHTKKRR